MFVLRIMFWHIVCTTLGTSLLLRTQYRAYDQLANARRVVDMQTGEVIVSDFLSNEIVESLNLFEKKEREQKRSAHAQRIIHVL